VLHLAGKRLRLQRTDLFILAFILIGTLLRFVLIYLHWPATNSDEANMALLARHVAYNGEWPIFFYGLPYMGPIEGYLAAPLFHLLGPSTFTLRLALLPFFSLFLICMYYLTRLLFTPKLAIFTVLLLCFGSDEVISRQVKAVGEYPELLFFAAFISLVTAWLTLSSHRVAQQARTTPPRIFIYGILGLVVGVAIWVDFLILPFLGTATVLLLLFCRRELRSWAGFSLLAGIVIGALPLLYYNVTAPLDQNSLGIHHAGAGNNLPFLQQIVGTLMISIPNATSFNPRCHAGDFPYFGVPNARCITLQGGWGIGYLILWVVATLLVANVIWRGWKHTSLLHPMWSFEERQHMIHYCCQLMLLISAGGTIFLYAISTAPALYPEATSRYLECVLIALPATLWPLWSSLSSWRTTVNWRTVTFSSLYGCIFLLILAMFVMGTFNTVNEIPSSQLIYQQQDQMVQKLLSLKSTRIYSEYWTCNRLTFQSEEKIICAALNEKLNPDFDRYIRYRSMVRAVAHPTYLFPQGSAQVIVLDARMKNDSQFRSTYQRLTFEGYVIYVPFASQS